MGLDLFPQKGREFVIAGPQFDMDPTKLLTITSDVLDDTLVTIYTVPTGKMLYISKIMLIAESDTPDSYWRVYIDNDVIYVARPTVNTTQEVDFPVPLQIEAGKIIKERWDKAAGAGTNRTAIIGWLL